MQFKKGIGWKATKSRFFDEQHYVSMDGRDLGLWLKIQNNLDHLTTVKYNSNSC